LENSLSEESKKLLESQYFDLGSFRLATCILMRGGSPADNTTCLMTMSDLGGFSNVGFVIVRHSTVIKLLLNCYETVTYRWDP